MKVISLWPRVWELLQSGGGMIRGVADGGGVEGQQ
jgi:hypothetical protein